MGTRIEIRDTGDLKRLNKQLKQVTGGKQLQRDFNKGIRDAMRPIVPEVRAAYLTAPPGKGGPRSRSRLQQPDLRVLLAKASHLEVRSTGRQAGARVRVDGRKMPSGMRSLPAYWEGYKPRWRWPVYGNRNVWAQGRARPLFDRVVAPFQPRVAHAIDRVCDDLKRKLEAI